MSPDCQHGRSAHCRRPGPGASPLRLDRSQGLAEIRAAYVGFSRAWDEYLNAVCGYDEAYYHGLHESEPSTGEMFDPYVAPSLCSQDG